MPFSLEPQGYVLRFPLRCEGSRGDELLSPVVSVHAHVREVHGATANKERRQGYALYRLPTG